MFRKPPIEGESLFYQYRFRPTEIEHFLKNAGFKVLQTVYWGNLETLWQYIVPLRHPNTRSFRWYDEVVMSGRPFRLTKLGKKLYSIIRRFTPWLFHYAWLIQAIKPKSGVINHDPSL